MKKRFKVGTKSFLQYSVVMIVVLLVYALVSLLYISGRAKDDYLRSVDYECGAIADDFTGLLDQMDHVTTFLLSEPDVLSAIQYVSRHEADDNRILYNRYTQDIRAALSSYYIVKYFYRVSYVNPKGGFATSSQWLGNYTEPEQIQEIIENRFSDVSSVQSAPEFRGIYEDPWSKEEKETVAGFVKRISGDQRGFFEIQVERADFEALFSREFSCENTVEAELAGSLIFSGQNAADGESPQNGTIAASDSGEILPDTVRFMEGGTEKWDSLTLLTCQEYDTAAGVLRIYCGVSMYELVRGMLGIYVSIVLLTLILTAGTFLFLRMYTRRLVVPINALKERMDKTGIENLEELESPLDETKELEEIVSLNKGYNRLISRIKEGMAREKKLESLQIRANLDTLQAQINPHFINNTLNVISYRGTLLGDDEICEVCSTLSSMLKFSSNTKKRTVTVKEELEYVEAYMQLLQYRYRDKFRYDIQVSPELYGQSLPRVVLQQLVENSVSHGYQKPYEVIQIEIKGWQENGWWHIEITDNGDGFQEEVLERLKGEMEQVKRMILDEHRIQEMEIGGMGILNIYSRMLLLHNQNFKFTIENLDHGARVTLSSVMEHEPERG